MCISYDVSFVSAHSLACIIFFSFPYFPSLFFSLSLPLQLTPVIDELNEILSDESMGGGLGGGHHLSLGMHLLHHLNSARKFTELLTTRYQHTQDIHCMQGFHQQLKVYTVRLEYTHRQCWKSHFTCIWKKHDI